MKELNLCTGESLVFTTAGDLADLRHYRRNICGIDQVEYKDGFIWALFSTFREALISLQNTALYQIDFRRFEVILN
jgi:hypothetical protein